MKKAGWICVVAGSVSLSGLLGKNTEAHLCLFAFLSENTLGEG